MNNLIVVEESNAVAVFTDNTMDETLQKIEKEVTSFVPDTSTAKGRKEIASLAHKVARSKTALDDAGKTLTADWKAKAKLVDASRKQARDFLDNLKFKVRQPLTEWEREQERKAEQERLARELEEAHTGALKENELFDREKSIAEKERLAREAEEERLIIEEAKRLEAEKLERERQLKEEAALKAKQEAEAEAQRKIDEANALRLAEEEKARQAEVSRLLEIEKAKQAQEQAERDRLAAIKQAEIDKQAAIESEQLKAKQEAERIERERLAAEAEAARIAKAKAENKAHRKAVNNKALKCFTNNKIDPKTAKEIIILIAENKIDGITINY